MKIAVKDLVANPFRGNKLPYDQEKIEHLKETIKSTGFWDNVVARKDKDGKYELAYGHHRWKALLSLGIKEIDIPIKDLSDGVMIQMMAQENLEDWGPKNVTWVLDVTKKAYDYLLEQKRFPDSGNLFVTLRELREFLALSKNTAEFAYEALRATGEICQHEKNKDGPTPDKITNREVLESFKSVSKANTYLKGITSIHKKRKKKIPTNVQKALAKTYSKEKQGGGWEGFEKAKKEVSKTLPKEQQKILREPKELPEIDDYALITIKNTEELKQRLIHLGSSIEYLSEYRKKTLSTHLKALAEEIYSFLNSITETKQIKGGQL